MRHDRKDTQFLETIRREVQTTKPFRHYGRWTRRADEHIKETASEIPGRKRTLNVIYDERECIPIDYVRLRSQGNFEHLVEESSIRQERYSRHKNRKSVLHVFCFRSSVFVKGGQLV